MHTSEPILYFVYELWNPITNKPFYVGKGHGDRPYTHITEAKSDTLKGNQHKLNTIRQILRSDEEVDIRTVFESFNEKKTISEEIRLIELYGRVDLKTGPLTNLTRGGDGVVGHSHTDKAKKKISEALKKRSRASRESAAEKMRGHPGWMTGKIHTDSTKEKMSEAQKQRYSNLSDDERKLMSDKYMGEKNPFYGKTHTDKAKNAMSKWKKENYIGRGNPFHGKKHTKEALKKISEASKNRSQETKDKISKARKGKPWSLARRKAQEDRNRRLSHV